MRRRVGGREEEGAEPYDRAAFALESRHACAPEECVKAEACWVILGTSESLRSGFQGTPRCLACMGKVRYERWRSPSQLGLPKYAGWRVGRSRGPGLR